MVNEIRGLRPCYRILVTFVKKEVMQLNSGIYRFVGKIKIKRGCCKELFLENIKHPLERVYYFLGKVMSKFREKVAKDDEYL